MSLQLDIRHYFVFDLLQGMMFSALKQDIPREAFYEFLFSDAFDVEILVKQIERPWIEVEQTIMTYVELTRNLDMNAMLELNAMFKSCESLKQVYKGNDTEFVWYINEAMQSIGDFLETANTK